ncbi:hypothetical protein T265_15633, partial [Opisthorchis viverrini]
YEDISKATAIIRARKHPSRYHVSHIYAGDLNALKFNGTAIRVYVHVPTTLSASQPARGILLVQASMLSSESPFVNPEHWLCFFIIRAGVTADIISRFVGSFSEQSITRLSNQLPSEARVRPPENK